ncbi:MAG: beta-L-arabinofuranosidase domain-containing protein [Sphingobacterium sp.]
MSIRIFLSTTVLLLTTIQLSIAQLITTAAIPKVDYVVPSQYDLAIPQTDILSGYLGNRYQLNLEKRLLQVDEEGLLEGFHTRPGKQRWIGEHIGKYLEAAANTWLVTKDSRLKQQMDRMFHRLLETQGEDGYLGTYLPENRWTSWDVWVHKYDLFGLLAYYGAVGDPKALNAATQIGDLLYNTFGDTPGKKNILKSGSHVGMAATSVIDPMLDLYRWTGDKKYLDFCRYIIRAYDFEGGPAIVTSILKHKRVDKVANAKAYEMLSNIVGLVKMYRLTGDKDLLNVINYTFDDISANRLFVTGTSSDHERFQDNHYLRADTSAHMGEGCVTTTWLQFNTQLFSITGDLKYYNEIEKTIYNHLLGAENPQTGCVSYYTPLIGEKPYRCNITCCLSSVPRGIALIPYLNFGQLNHIPTILLYEPAQIKEKIKTSSQQTIPLELTLTSEFPRKGTATLQVNLPQSAQFPLQLRVPEWATNYTATINGKTYKSEPNQLLKIVRHWKDNDKISISFDIRTEIVNGGKTYPGSFTLKRGPQIFALDQSLNPQVDFETAKLVYPEKAAIKLTEAQDKLPKNWVGTLAYSTDISTSDNKKQSILLVPYADASQTGGFSKVWIPTTGR